MNNAFARFIGLVATAVLSACVHAGIPNTQTQSFLDATGAKAMFNEHDRIIALYAVPMDTNPPPSPQPTSSAEFDAIVDDFVDDFVDENADAFGVPGVQLTPMDNTINIRGGKFRVRKYAQVKTVGTETLTVHGSVVTIPALIMPDQEQRIGYVGIQLVPLPEYFPVQTVDEGDAEEIVESLPEYSQLAFDAPVKVIYEDSSQVVHRAWRFMGSSSEESYLFFVDVADGELVHVTSLTSHATVSGTVKGYATNLEQINPEDHRADGPDNQPVFGPIPDVYVSLYRDAVDGCPSSDGTLVETLPTDVDGAFEFLNVSDQWTGLRLRTELVGDWVRVLDFLPSRTLLHCVDDVENAPTAIPLELNSLPQDTDWDYPEDQYGTAQVNAFLVGTASHDFIKKIQPAFTGVDTQAIFYVNQIGCGDGNAANPFFLPPSATFSSANYGGEFINCRNGALTTVISHEYMHIIQGRIFGVTAYPDERFREGTSDAFASFLWKTPYFGQDVYGDGMFIRRLDTPNVQADCEPVTEPESEWEDCPCHDNDDALCHAGPPHCCGLALAGSLWDMREAMIVFDPTEGEDKANERFADFMFVTDGSWDNSYLLDVLVVDDNDGDLTNGTPHSNLIIDAFNDHGFNVELCVACPDDVKVEWVGPTTQLEPIAGIDYTVSYQSDPPYVILHTTQVEDDNEVTLWRVGRLRHPETNAIQSLGTITAVWNEPGFNVEIEVGTIASAPLSDVTICDIPAQSESNWTSLVFDIRGDLLIRAQAYAAEPRCVGGENDGQPCGPLSVCPGGACARQGGRISGVIDGNANQINAEAIGLGAGDSGSADLAVLGEQLGMVSLSAIPTDKSFHAGVLRGSLIVTGGFGGSIAVQKILGPQPDGILTEGRIVIAGDSDGSINLDEVLGRGYYEASVEIQGDYSGTMIIGKLLPGPTFPPVIRFGNLSGQIQVSGTTPVVGSIEVVGTPQSSGNIESGGLIWFAPQVSASGQITVAGEVKTGGRITIIDALAGEVEVGSIATGGRLELLKGVASGGSATVVGNSAGYLDLGTSATFVGNVSGNVAVGGAVSGLISHYGRTTSTGAIELGSVVSGGKYTQTFPNSPGPWEGSLTVNGNMAGSISLHTKLQYADLEVKGSMSGKIEIRDMFSSNIALNTVNSCSNSTSGDLIIGAKQTLWQPDSNGFLNIGNIDIWGQLTSTGEVTFVTCLPESPDEVDTIELLCLHRPNAGGLVRVLDCSIPGQPTLLTCPSSPDPCCGPGC